MNNIKEKIQSLVIDRIKDEISIELMDLYSLQRIINSLGIELELGDDWETNGWQCDYWWSFEYDKLPFVISGGLFVSDITIALNTDKLDDELCL